MWTRQIQWNQIAQPESDRLSLTGWVWPAESGLTWCSVGVQCSRPLSSHKWFPLRSEWEFVLLEDLWRNFSVLSGNSGNDGSYCWLQRVIGGAYRPLTAGTKGGGVDQVELIHPPSPPRPCRPPRPPRWFWDQQGHDKELKPGFSSEVKRRSSFKIEQIIFFNLDL